uniref:Uncharacterized protein n=1 Tax=Arundo donax TaxID=35708 RepID=A0A0A9B384_ARUDO
MSSFAMFHWSNQILRPLTLGYMQIMHCY